MSLCAVQYYVHIVWPHCQPVTVSGYKIFASDGKSATKAHISVKYDDGEHMWHEIHDLTSIQQAHYTRSEVKPSVSTHSWTVGCFQRHAGVWHGGCEWSVLVC